MQITLTALAVLAGFFLATSFTGLEVSHEHWHPISLIPLLAVIVMSHRWNTKARQRVSDHLDAVEAHLTALEEELQAKRDLESSNTN